MRWLVSPGLVATLLALQVDSAWAQVATGEGVQVPVTRIILSFLVCVAIGVIAILLLRARGTGKLLSIKTAPRRIKVIETNRINVRSSLILVEVEGRRMLLSSDTTGTRLVVELAPNMATAEESSP